MASKTRTVVTTASRHAIENLRGAVYSVPTFGSGAMFEAGTAAFEVANTSDKDMRVAFNVDPGPQLNYADKRSASR